MSFDAEHGKGSHGTLRFGDRSTTIPYVKREPPRGLFAALCRQLGIDPEELRNA